ncbi:hypothetical protein [Hyphococcus sp. DH-69]|uniref:hypothetical protein n=1 Tax=Hyphococcus formosus TaxID=3143534 RepID=UPI00398A930E
MARKAPVKDTVRNLFARSGNRCAYPECQAPLIEDDGLFVGQIVHIHAAEAGGPRFDPLMSDEDRRSLNNLIVLCYPHHKRVDTKPYASAEDLQEIKKRHERSFEQDGFLPTDAALEQIVREQSNQWTMITTMNAAARDEFDLILELNADLPFEKHVGLIKDANSYAIELCGEMQAYVEQLVAKIPGDQIEEWRDAQGLCFWEQVNIGATNADLRVRASLLVLELRYLDLRLQLDPDNSKYKSKAGSVREKLEAMAKDGYYFD